jgi:hypothetical protein
MTLQVGLTSCQTAPPNIPVCVEIAIDRGACIKTISGEKFDIDERNTFEGQTWWGARPTMLMIPSSSWAKLKTYIITQCKRTGQCTKEISSWDRTIQTIDKTLESKR